MEIDPKEYEKMKWRASEISSSSESESEDRRTKKKNNKQQLNHATIVKPAKTTDKGTATPKQVQKEASNDIIEPNEKKTTIPPMILESDRHWKTLHTWMIKNGIDFRSKVTRDGGLHIEAKTEEGYRKLQDRLQNKNSYHHIFGTEKSDLKVVMSLIPSSSSLDDIKDDLFAKGIKVNSVYNTPLMGHPRNVLPLFLVKRGQDKV